MAIKVLIKIAKECVCVCLGRFFIQRYAFPFALSYVRTILMVCLRIRLLINN